MPSISVIMPVYNSEKYLKKAIESVLNQSFCDFELLLINDGSSDQSGKICDVYSRYDSRVIVIHKENGGISSARNKGIEIAKGEYIAFIDNDDEYMPKLLEENYLLLKKYNADAIKFNRIKLYYDINEKEKKVITDYKKRLKKDIMILEGEELNQSFLYLRRISFLIYVWTGIFRRELIIKNQIVFDESVKYGGEDVLFNLQFYKNANKYICNSKVYYKYKKRNFHSTSEKFDINRIETEIKILQLINEIIFTNDMMKDKEKKWLEVKIEGIIGILLMLHNKNCSFNIRQKKEYLKYLKKSSLMDLRYNKDIINKKENYKFRVKLIIAFLYNHNYYYILLIIIKIISFIYK